MNTYVLIFSDRIIHLLLERQVLISIDTQIPKYKMIINKGM